MPSSLRRVDKRREHQVKAWLQE
uniref:Transposase n=1 Tax=Steinernema glaseri TaxID=37863 RepID=A0A1I7Z631_9BILA